MRSSHLMAAAFAGAASFIATTGTGAAAPTPVNIVFTQIGGPPATDVKVTFNITDLNNAAFFNLGDGDCIITLSAYEEDVLPFTDDFLGTFTVTVKQGEVTALAGGGYTRTGFMAVLTGGVAAGGGLSDNSYYLAFDSAIKTPLPASAVLLGGALLGLGAAGRRKRQA
ncbi:MAG: hypothetical protein ACJA1L_002709 [Paracoccaceae bacterium]|jgi:hypothetical protein